MAESWSLTHKKKCRMQSLMRCTGNGTTWWGRPWFVKVPWGDSSVICWLCPGHTQFLDKQSYKRTFEECVSIRSIVPANLVTGIISQERWQQRRKKVEEDTSMSPSGLYFGHYIAGADCDYISQFHALCIHLALKKSIALECWANGWLVMFFEDVWCTISLKTPTYFADGSRL